jgi:hypothetical protein
VFRAPLDYVNVGVCVEDREVRTVALDEDRAPLVKVAFELFATGKYSVPSLAGELFLRGLKSRATRNRAADQLSDSQMFRLLQDPYYLGLTRIRIRSTKVGLTRSSTGHCSIECRK